MYHQPFPASDRDFTPLILTREAPDSTSFLVVSIPYDHPDAQPQKGFVRAKYASVEHVRVLPGNRGVEWRMIVTSDAGGRVPDLMTGALAGLLSEVQL
jgi:hypothetical protein